jgi:hypothetical protein
VDKIVYSWFNDEKTVLLCTYPAEHWTWEDFHNAFHTQKAMIDGVSHPKVHVIVDASKGQWLPKGGSLMSGVRKMTDLKHPRQGHTIVVGAKGLIASIASAVTKLMGAHRQEMHLVNTMQEATDLLSRLTERVPEKTR